MEQKRDPKFWSNYLCEMGDLDFFYLTLYYSLWNEYI